MVNSLAHLLFEPPLASHDFGQGVFRAHVGEIRMELKYMDRRSHQLESVPSRGSVAPAVVLYRHLFT